MVHYGTRGDDLFLISDYDLIGDTIKGRAGRDTLAVESGDDYTFDRSSYRRLSRVEEIDFTGIGGALSIKINGSILRQADGDVLTMTFGDTGPIYLNARAFDGGSLVLNGEGTIQLSGSVSNSVTLSNSTTLLVHGGAGDDRIQAGNDGNLLDGGAGDDVLIAGDGSDTVRFGEGFGADTVMGFDSANDIIALEDLQIADLDALMALVNEATNGLEIDFGNGDLLMLEGVSVGALASAQITLNGIELPSGSSVIDISVGTTAADLNAMIADAEAGTVFQLAAGEHIFDQTIVIARDDISFLGHPNGGTAVRFSFAAGQEGNGLVVQGTPSIYVSTLPAAAGAGDTVIELRDGHGFEAGDAIYLQQPNTQYYLGANGWTNVSMAEAEFRPFRESINIIESVDGNNVTLASPLSYDLEAGAGRYYTIDLVEGVRISDFEITYDLGATNTYDFSNTQAAFEGTSALLLDNTSGIEISGLAFTDVASTALNLSSTIGAVVDGVSISGSHNKGGGGNGYGIELHEAFNNTLTGLTIMDMRHSLVLSAWHAETGNTVEIIETNRDINLHGSPDHGNAITVGSAILDYDFDNSGDSWAILSAGGTNHAATDFSANDVSFGIAIASDRNDTINGNDSGSLLVGGFGYDTLTGGSSADVLIGGTRRDTMTGGDGADTFLLVMGDDLDRITDFTFGIGGDTLIFSGNSAVEEADDLTITQDGDDARIRYGSNSTVVLEGVLVIDIDEANFQFDPNGAFGVDDFPIA
ncbi:MAG: calcium-binding protein [Rhizobiaceae bacterium]